MHRLMAAVSAVACALSLTASSVFACGTPPEPPPPPPDPPIVCCVIVDWFVRPDMPDCEYLLVRYFRQDGLPLYQSNPMPLFPNQQCLCSLPAFPSNVPPNVQVVGFSFGNPDILPWQGLPENAPGYGPFEPIHDPNIVSQIRQFNGAYNAAAGDTIPGTAPPQVFGFGGPGQIPPGVVFDVFQLIKIPVGFDPRNLCPFPGAMAPIGLFLGQDGQVFAEPLFPGQPPIPFPQFQQNPGASAFYKFKWYPLIVPPPCPPLGPSCPGDINGDGLRDFTDLNILLGVYNVPCP